MNNLGRSVGALIETRASEENSASLLSGLLQERGFDSNYSVVAGGRIWVLWDKSLSVVIFSKSEQMIVCGVFDPVTKRYVTVGFVYAYNTEGQKKKLWEELVSLSSHHLVKNRPLVLLGDFN